MLFSGILLACLGLVLAWPVPSLLSTATPRDDPIALVVLWQAIGLAGGLSLIGTAFVLAVSPFADDAHDALFGLLDLDNWATLSPWHWILLCLAVLLIVRLLWCLAAQAVTSARHRRRHAELVSLLTTPSTELPGTRILDSQDPVAYCLPGRDEGTTVISTGLLKELDEAQRRAVVAHERAHLTYRHHLLTLSFASWHRALPFVPATRVALGAVNELMEIMADDLARRTVAPDDLASAVEIAARIHPGKHDDELTRIRVQRLSVPVAGRQTTARASAVVLSAGLLLIPPTLLFLPFLG